MDPEPEEFRDFPEPIIIDNDDVAPPTHALTVNQTLNHLSGEFDSSLSQNITFDDQSSTDLINKDNQVQEHQFQEKINQEKHFIEQDILINKNNNIKQFHSIIQNLKEEIPLFNNRISKNSKNNHSISKVNSSLFLPNQYQSIFSSSQSIAGKNLGEKLSLFCSTCRSLITSVLNIRQNTSILTFEALEMLTSYAPNSNFLTPDMINTILDQKELSSNENNYQHRLEYARIIIHLLKQANKLRLDISSLNDLLIKSVLPKNERFIEIEQSLRLPSNFFDNQNSLYQIFFYELNPTTTTKQDIYIRSLRGQLTQNDIHIVIIENPKHILSQINYNAGEKYSYIFDIEFKRTITNIDQLTIALPCFSLPSDFQSQQQIYIRCKRIMDPLIHIPARIEIFNQIPYAIFRLTQSLSAISVEAILFYPFEIFQTSHHDSISIYTTEQSARFRIETPRNYFLRPPRVRIIPFNTELIRCMMALQREDQLIASSDLIEFEWYKETKMEGILSITIQLTRNFNLINETNEDLQKRRRKAQRKILSQREKFEQEKSDEAGGSLSGTPTSLTSPTVMTHLPSIAAIIERTIADDHQQPRRKTSFTLHPQIPSQSNSSIKTPLKWKLDGFKNENAPIILLGYKNRKWKNCNHFATIIPTAEKNTYTITLTSLLDRIILIRCWSESNSEGKFDKLAENLWSLTSIKLFSCVLARDPSSVQTLGHYALVIVPIQKQNLAEDILRKRNYTEFIFDESSISQNNSKTQLPKIIQYESHHTLLARSSLRDTNKYVQFCLSEGTYVRIVPMGNIDVHEKVELTFRLHAQYPVVLEFDIYPIDIYRQKTDKDFIGTLNIYQINTCNLTVGSTSSTLTAAANSSRTSSGSKDLEILEGLPANSSARTSVSGPESISNSGATIGRSGFERLTARDFNENSLISAIRIRLPKDAFNLPSTQSKTIPVIVPEFFKGVVESLTEGKREFAEALNIHPALMNPLSQKRENDVQPSKSFHGNSRMHLSKDETTKIEQSKLENNTLFRWLKRQNAFKTNETIDNIVSALIHIGRVDLAYIIKIENLRNQCEV